MRFPFSTLGGKRIPDYGSRMGCRFRIGPQAETTSQIPPPNRDALSRRGLWRKLRPGMSAQNGTRFPDGSQTETASRNRASERGCRFRLESRAESAFQNPGNSVNRWLSKRNAKDAERKTYNENGVKTALRMA